MKRRAPPLGPLLATALCAALAAAVPARADPVLERVETAIVDGRKLEIRVDSVLGGTGAVVVEGTVNGRPLALRKRVRAGTRSTRLRVLPRRAKVRKAEGPILFDLDVTLVERGTEVRAVRSVEAEIPVPLVFLPGYGNENAPEASVAFAGLLDAAAGGIYGGAEGGTLEVHGYPSAAESLGAHAEGLGRRVRRMLRRSPFSRVDLVGYSMGGLVARRWIADRGAERVRRCVFVATPNEGIPLAYVAVGLHEQGLLEAILTANGIDVAEFGDIGDALFTAETRESLRVFYPTYAWVEPPAAAPFVTLLLGDDSTPLRALNAIAPPEGVEFHALYYTSTPLGALGTVDRVDATVLAAALQGGPIDAADVASGSGDGLVPAHSVHMAEVPAWSAAIVRHDLGAGTHLTALTDPSVIAEIVQILRGEP